MGDGGKKLPTEMRINTNISINYHIIHTHVYPLSVLDFEVT